MGIAAYLQLSEQVQLRQAVAATGQGFILLGQACGWTEPAWTGQWLTLHLQGWLGLRTDQGTQRFVGEKFSLMAEKVTMPA